MTRLPESRNDPSLSLLGTYLQEINKTALLTAEEEKELAYRIVGGDGQARDHMVRANLRLVVNIARSYSSKGVGLQDLIEEGNLGLMRAVEGFDPTMNTRFSTYASFWIKQSIKRALVNSAKTIRLPAYMVDLLSKWRQAAAQLQDELGRTPTSEEIGKRIGLPKKKQAIIERAIRIYTSAPLNDQMESSNVIEELLMDRRVKSPETDLVESDERRQIGGLLEQMEPRQAAVLRMRFGLDGDEPKTLKEIGEALGLTRERVRQIQSEALGKLAEELQAG